MTCECPGWPLLRIALSLARSRAGRGSFCSSSPRWTRLLALAGPLRGGPRGPSPRCPGFWFPPRLVPSHFFRCAALSLHGPWQYPAAQSPCGPVAQGAPVLAGSRGEPSRPPSCPSLQGVGSSSLSTGRLPGPLRAPLVRALLFSFTLLSSLPLCWVSLRHTILTSSFKGGGGRGRGEGGGRQRG